MAAFSRKPLRRVKLFHLFGDEHFDMPPPKPEAEQTF
jgi:hypothetical protein